MKFKIYLHKPVETTATRSIAEAYGYCSGGYEEAESMASSALQSNKDKGYTSWSVVALDEADFEREVSN